MRPSTLAALATVTVLTGCMLGSRPSTHPIASRPAGMSVDLRMLDDQRVEGELLAVDDTSLVIRTDSVFTRVPFNHVKHGELETWKYFRSRSEWQNLVADPALVAQLRTRARYPQGMDPDLEGRVLAAYGATEVRPLP